MDTTIHMISNTTISVIMTTIMTRDNTIINQIEPTVISPNLINFHNRTEEKSLQKNRRILVKVKIRCTKVQTSTDIITAW